MSQGLQQKEGAMQHQGGKVTARDLQSRGVSADTHGMCALTGAIDIHTLTNQSLPPTQRWCHTEQSPGVLASLPASATPLGKRTSHLQHHLSWIYQNLMLCFSPTGSDQAIPTNDHGLWAIPVTRPEGRPSWRVKSQTCSNSSCTDLLIHHIYHNIDSWIHNMDLQIHSMDMDSYIGT